MSAPPPCKACDHLDGRLTADRREALYAGLIRAIDTWAEFGPGEPRATPAAHLRGYVQLLAADDQGLCVACADKAVLPW